MTLTTSSNKSTFQQFATVFRWSLRKHLGLSALYGLLLFMTMPIWLIFSLANQQKIYPNFVEPLVCFLYYPITLLFTLLFTGILFGYLHKKRSMDLFHSLPIGRNTLLLARFCAGLVLILVPLFVNYLITAALYYPSVSWYENPNFNRMFLEQTIWFLILTVLVFFTFCMFISVCCGTTADSVVSILTISVMYPGLILLTSLVQQALLPGFTLFSWQDLNVLTALSPAGCFASGVVQFIQEDFSSLSFHLWWLLFLAVVFVAALLLNQRRKSEQAESPFAFAAPAVIIRALASFVVGLGFGYVLSSATSGTVGIFYVGMVIGSLAAHLVLEAIYSRGFKKLWKTMPYYGGVVAVMFIFVLVLSTGVFGMAYRVPTLENVESVSLSGYALRPYIDTNYSSDGTYYLADNNNTDSTKQYTPTVKSEENIQRVIQLHRLYMEKLKNGTPFKNGYGNRLSLDYTLKDGTHLVREFPNVNIDDYDYSSEMEELSETEEFKRSAHVIFHIEGREINLFNLNFEYTYDDDPEDSYPQKTISSLSDAQKEELRQALCKDVLANNPTDEKNWYSEQYENYNVWSITVEPYYSNDSGTTYADARNFSSSTYTIYPYFTNTLEVLKKYDWLTNADLYSKQQGSAENSP